MNWSMPGFSVLHYLPEVAQTHVQWVGDAIQPSHPLSTLSPALNLSQHQGFFQWVSSLCYRVLYLAEGNLSITQLCKLKSHHITWVCRVSYPGDERAGFWLTNFILIDWGLLQETGFLNFRQSQANPPEKSPKGKNKSQMLCAYFCLFVWLFRL